MLLATKKSLKDSTMTVPEDSRSVPLVGLPLAVVVTTGIFLLFAILGVSIRFYVGFWKKILGLDDGMMLFSLVRNKTPSPVFLHSCDMAPFLSAAANLSSSLSVSLYCCIRPHHPRGNSGSRHKELRAERVDGGPDGQVLYHLDPGLPDRHGRYQVVHLRDPKAHSAAHTDQDAHQRVVPDEPQLDLVVRQLLWCHPAVPAHARQLGQVARRRGQGQVR